MLALASLVLVGILVLPLNISSNTVVGVTYVDGFGHDPETVKENIGVIAGKGYGLVRVVWGMQHDLDVLAPSIEAFISACAEHKLYTYVVVNSEPGRLEFQVEQTYLGKLEQFLGRYGNQVSFLQIFNEIDDLRKSDGTNYMPSEIVNCVKLMALKAKAVSPQTKIVATFTQLATIRLDLLSKLGELRDCIDYVGLDIYADAQALAKTSIDQLAQASGKSVIVTETGSNNPDPAAKASQIRQSVQLYRNLAVLIVIVFDWSGSTYSVKDLDLKW